MAHLDDEENTIVLRIVYAGPPLSGKTQSLNTLAQLLLGEPREEAVFTPAQAEGRTLYFDWLDYVGGLFNGRRIRCQIVSVPGQDALSARRQLILGSADAVVYVVDSDPERISDAARYFQELYRFIHKRAKVPPVGIIVQANKRDLKDAVPLKTIREALGDNPNLGISETSATLGMGIRETFVRAVGIALERVSALLVDGAVTDGRSEIDSGAKLLHFMEKEEERGQTVPSMMDSSNGQSRSASHHEPRPAFEVPPLPTNDVAPGAISPPITGRIIMHEIEKDQIDPEQLEDGSWVARAGRRWWLRSEADHFFEDLSCARQRLLEYSRLSEAVEGRISVHRCAVLVQEGDSRWRLWQIVRTEKHLGYLLMRILMEEDAAVLAREILDAVNVLIRAIREFEADERFSDVRPDTISLVDGKPVYAGMISFSKGKAAQKPSHEATVQLIRDHLGARIHRVMSRSPVDISLALRWLREFGRERGGDKAVVDTLSALMIGH